MSVIPTKAARRRPIQPLLEELEVRLCPTGVCQADPAYEAECTYLNNLIPASSATDVAVKSGNWSDPSTWSKGVPGQGATVWIPQGDTVTVDGQETAALRGVLVNGTLIFAPNVNTSLLVNTIVVGTDTNTPGTPQGELDIGTAQNPIQPGVTAQLIFADSQSVAPGETQQQLFPNDFNPAAGDNEQMSGGLISMGTVNMVGSQVTPYLNLVGGVSAGATTMTLDSQPAGWKVGDTLLIPGTDPSRTQTEQIRIAGITDNADGTCTVKLASPLKHAHSAPSGQQLQIADENRNVIIKDEGTPTQYMDGSDGHVMFMHNDAVNLQYVAFLDPGRTNKSQPLFTKLSNGTINQIGRYSVHFHQDYYPSINGQDPPIQVVGCYQAGGVGWGYVNHSSNVDFCDDVAFNDFGSSFVDQAGNELGEWMDCLSVQTPGVPNTYNLTTNRFNVQDFGWNGQGFWLQGPSTALIDNHVWDAQLSYDLYFLGFNDPNLGVISSWNHQNVSFVPMATFSGNTAGETQEAFQAQWGEGATPYTVNNFAAWGITSVGADLLRYDDHWTLNNLTLLAAPGSGATYGLHTNPGGYAFHVNASNIDIEGFNIGYSTPTSTANTVNGGYMNDATAFYIPALNGAGRTVTFSGPITFGPDVRTAYNVQSINLALLANGAGQDLTPFFAPDQILLPDGRQLYTPGQAANYVPFPGGTNQNVPAAWVGLTNAQLWAQYGVAPGGFVAPANAAGDPSTNGSIGPAQAVLTTASLAESAFAWVGSPYVLKYALRPPGGPAGVVQTDPNPVTLQQGWNVLTRVINGTTYSWLVYGNLFSRLGLPSPTLGAAYGQSIMVPAGYKISFAVTSGAIPAGLTFSTSGNTLTVAGTPKAAGTVTFNLTATDPTGKATTQSYTLTVNPQNVSGQVSWTASTPTYNSSTKTYDGTITLTNNGPTALTGTLMAVLTGLPNGVTVANANGLSNVNPYLLVSLPGGTLAAGQSVTFTVRFRNPSQQPFNYGLTTFEQSL